eukprot:m.162992 g.162992  ORF g.162992 m.162992 type:complete len:304 (+) comp17677_c0_seq5:124-1035(+)
MHNNETWGGEVASTPKSNKKKQSSPQTSETLERALRQLLQGHGQHHGVLSCLSLSPQTRRIRLLPRQVVVVLPSGVRRGKAGLDSPRFFGHLLDSLLEPSLVSLFFQALFPEPLLVLSLCTALVLFHSCKVFFHDLPLHLLLPTSLGSGELLLVNPALKFSVCLLAVSRRVSSSRTGLHRRLGSGVCFLLGEPALETAFGLLPAFLQCWLPLLRSEATLLLDFPLFLLFLLSQPRLVGVSALLAVKPFVQLATRWWLEPAAVAHLRSHQKKQKKKENKNTSLHQTGTCKVDGPSSSPKLAAAT